MKLWYEAPGAAWNEALPIGNGRLGAMVFGGLNEERLQLNEDTLWSGERRELNRDEALQALPRARELIAAGRYAEAQQVVEREMLGEWNESYLPLGYLDIAFEHDGEAADYRRELDLADGVVRAAYRAGGASYERTALASAPDGVIAVRLETSAEGGLRARVRLGSQLPHETYADGAAIVLTGQCPAHVEPSYVKECDQPIVYREGVGMRFAATVRVVPEGGRLTAGADGELAIDGARAVTLLLAAATSHRSEASDLPARCGEIAAVAASRGWEGLLARHAADYRALFGRVALELGGEERDAEPTDARVRRMAEGDDDPALAALLFQYGRYLLLSSSRPGTEAANLQGIWNDELRPPWSSNYTTNINAQMNYWPAEVCNLSECHEPLLRLVEEISVAGRETAARHYGARGWTAHHNVDLWRTTVPAKGRACWSFWPMGGPWLSLHMWDHYAFTLDRDFLRRTGYPVMKEAALFCLDWLIEDADGYLTTSPSTSPENEFVAPDGSASAVSAGSTMDMSIIRELFGCVAAASRALDCDAELRAELERAAARLVPFREGRHGQLQEWSVDFDETEPGHRHFSHLFGLFPGSQVDLRAQPELAALFRRTLERRQAHGAGRRGWGGAWAMHFWARLEDGERAHAQVKGLFGSIYPNLFNGHSVYQIDGNLGFTSGVAEMLVQSHAGEIAVLPALPAAWPDGRVAGLRARGGYTVDIEWSGGALRRVGIRADKDGECRIRLHAAEARRIALAEAAGGAPLLLEQPEPGVWRFAAKAGAVYALTATASLSDEREPSGR